MYWPYTPLYPPSSHQNQYSLQNPNNLHWNLSQSWSSFYIAQPPPYSPNPTPQPMQKDDDFFNSRTVFLETQKRKRYYADYPTIMLLLAVWSFLPLSSILLLFFSHVASLDTSDAGEAVSQTEIAVTIAWSSIPILLAAILNEVLVERCWRRVVCSALGDGTTVSSDYNLAANLRAANFEWLNFIERLWNYEVSFQDFRVLASYGLLRWGTAISIASVQLCVSWHSDGANAADKNEPLYTARKRHLWLIGPTTIHALSVLGPMVIWLLPPWTFFGSRFDDFGLLERYLPYLKRVGGGSIANYEIVARYLDPRRTKPTLQRKNRPGIQFFAKLKGIWFGLLCMLVPPLVAWVLTRYTKQSDILSSGFYRFAFHLVFLAQNIFYLLALDFVIWNISLEGLSKRTSSHPNRSLRHLGSSSGIMLLVKALKQRRPLRAAIFIWLFWLQACLMRFFTVLVILEVTLVSYGTRKDQQNLWDPGFWLGWGLMTGFFVFPLFLLWLFTAFQAPICGQDGWRWAKIAQNALLERGFYGVRKGEATWAEDVDPFNSHRGAMLS